MMISDKVNVKIPAMVQRITSEKDYDGCENICAFHIGNNIHVPEKIAQKYKDYEGKICDCHFEDDSYCLAPACRREECPHRVKVGFVKIGEHARVYPDIDDCLLTLCIDGLTRPMLIMPMAEANKIITEVVE